MRRLFVTLFVLAFASTYPAAAQGQKKEGGGHQHAHEHKDVGAHQHGHGSVNIAIEGNRLSIELEAPGDDIVGFERVAKTKKDKAAIAAADEKLRDTAKLFELPAAAQCQVVKSDVKLLGGKGEHNEFHASYEYDCATIGSLDRIDFKYFTAFPRAKELEVAVINEQGQLKFEATRKKTLVKFGEAK